MHLEKVSAEELVLDSDGKDVTSFLCLVLVFVHFSVNNSVFALCRAPFLQNYLLFYFLVKEILHWEVEIGFEEGGSYFAKVEIQCGCICMNF